jgi:hypothetical protein
MMTINFDTITNNYMKPQKNARTPEQYISLRNLCKNFWLEETAILDM